MPQSKKIKREGVPLSVIVHTRDEAAQIGECLASCLGWADEVIVADMESRDETKCIAKAEGARVLDIPYEEEFDRTRNDSAAAARNEWILFLDADERLTPEVRETIESLIAGADESVGAFQLPFKTVSFGTWIQHAGRWWPSYKSPPLLRKGRFKFPGGVHLPAQIEGEIVRIEPRSDRDAIEHFSHPSVEAYFSKLNRYTSLEVRKLTASDATPHWHRAADRMAGTMRWYYDDTEGRIDGLAGFLLALGSGMYEAAAEMKFMESRGSTELPASAEEFFDRAAAAARIDRNSDTTALPPWAEQLCSWLCEAGESNEDPAEQFSEVLAQGDGWLIADIENLRASNNVPQETDCFVLLRDCDGEEKDAVRLSIAKALGTVPHCLEIAGSSTRWWFCRHNASVPARLRICSLAHSNALSVMGGGEVQLFQTVRALREHGVVSDVQVGGTLPSGYPLCHVYSLHHPVDVAGRASSPYVLTPIYWDRRELAWAAPKLTALFSRAESEEEISSGYESLRAQASRSMLPPVAFSEETKRLVAGAAIVAPNAERERECLERSMGTTIHSCQPIPNALCNLPSASDDGRLDSMLPERPFVLCVGRVEPNKNQLTLVWALKDTGFDVVLIGSQPDRRYADLCRQFGGDRVHLLGQQPPVVVRQAYERAAAHCLPSFGETPGIANLEAASLGCPILVSDRGAEREYFGEWAWYVDPLDPRSVAQAVIEAGNARGSERALALQTHVRAEFTWDKAAEKLAEVYRDAARKVTEAV